MFERDAILKKIKAHAQTELAEHMMPAEIHIIEKMPITENIASVAIIICVLVSMITLGLYLYIAIKKKE